MNTTFKLFLSVILSVVFALSATELRHRRDGSLILVGDPLTRAEALAADHRWAEAQLLADFVRRHPHLGDVSRADTLVGRSERELTTLEGKLRSFSRGMVSGEPTDTASLLGSLSLDLFIVGDIRDLVVQGWRQYDAGEGDQVIMALAGVGLITTLAPELDWVPALLKTFRRTGAMSRAFSEELLRLTRLALKTGRLGPLTETLGSLGRAAERLGPGPLRGVMRYVEDGDQLARVSKAAARDPSATYAVTTLFGRTGVRRLDREGGNISKLVGAIKFGSRFTKITRKGLSLVPSSWLFLLLLGAPLVLLRLWWPQRRPRRLDRPRLEPSLPASPSSVVVRYR